MNLNGASRVRGRWRIVSTAWMVLVLLAACASAGGDRRSDLPPVRVHFARTLSTTAAFQSMAVTVGWKRLALLERGTFVEMDFPPGTYNVRVTCSGDCLMRTIKMVVEVRPGEPMYFVIDPDFKVEKDHYVYTSRVLQVDRQVFDALLPKLRRTTPRRSL